MLSDKVVAVKKLFENTGHLFFEDKEALQMATKLRHRNIVSILGFCDEGNDKLLVYDFVPNRSLDQFLSGIYAALLFHFKDFSFCFC